VPNITEKLYESILHEFTVIQACVGSHYHTDWALQSIPNGSTGCLQRL